MKESVLVVDGGGRGSALVDAYAKSPHVGEILAVPGNDLMQDLTEKAVRTFPQLKTTSVSEIVDICKEQKISLVDVAQDNAVEAGLTDALIREGIKVIGPTRAAGQIEWSKVFARRLGDKLNLPQPNYFVFECLDDAQEFLDKQKDRKWFVKADGLAEGKGALGAKSNKEAKRRVEELKRFGRAADRFLLEYCLEGDDGSAGEEFSAFYLSDGENIKHLGDAQDHKRVFDFDEGENTGGMGCSSPPLALTQSEKMINESIVQSLVWGLRDRKTPFRGVFYLGGMLVRREGGELPYIVEENARWGDPEAQVIVPGIKNDFFEMGMAVAEGNISGLKIERDNKARVVVAGVSRGYPGDYEAVRGKEIFGLEEASKEEGVRLYSAGVKVEEGRYFASGGRLFYIEGEGEDVFEARRKAYGAMHRITIEGGNLHYRKDIGWRDVVRLRG